MNKELKTRIAKAAKLFRYINYVAVSLKPESFKSWMEKGAPKPFAKPKRHFDTTTKSEILRVFSRNFRVQTRSVLDTRQRALSRSGI